MIKLRCWLGDWYKPLVGQNRWFKSRGLTYLVLRFIMFTFFGLKWHYYVLLEHTLFNYEDKMKIPIFKKGSKKIPRIECKTFVFSFNFLTVTEMILRWSRKLSIFEVYRNKNQAIIIKLTSCRRFNVQTRSKMWIDNRCCNLASFTARKIDWDKVNFDWRLLLLVVGPHFARVALKMMIRLQIWR